MQYGPTWLQLVNTVLTRLRESEVNSVSDNTYSSLIGDLVNQSKREVENAWRWQDLRTSYEVPTVAGIITYSLDGTDERVQVLDLWNASERTEMRKVTWQKMNRLYFGASAPATGTPKLWTPNGQEASLGAWKFDIYPVPALVYTIIVNAYAPQPDLAADGDRMYCPSRPVVELTLARALQERGEDGGQGSLSQYTLYNQVLSDAIAIDANQHPADITWRAI